jgi:hypothetical protein
MSMMGELKYFLGFQIKQLQEGTFISQTKYIQGILKKFGMKNAKPIKTLMPTPKFELWYPKGFTFDLIWYSDADYAGCKIDRKSTSGTCQFLGRSLMSWALKNKT